MFNISHEMNNEKYHREDNADASTTNTTEYHRAVRAPYGVTEPLPST